MVSRFLFVFFALYIKSFSWSATTRTTVEAVMLTQFPPSLVTIQTKKKEVALRVGSA